VADLFFKGLTFLFLSQNLSWYFAINRADNCIYRDSLMRTHFIFKVAALAGLLALTGCASKLPRRKNILVS
jgi:hypothetical protein